MNSIPVKVIQRGTKTVLPIKDFFVEGICIRYRQMPILVFSNGKDRFHLTIQSSNIELLRGSNSLLKVYTDENHSRNGEVFQPILELIGCEVEDAVAEKQGELTIVFSNKLELSIDPEVYEGWNFNGENLDVIGADGKLIFCFG